MWQLSDKTIDVKESQSSSEKLYRFPAQLQKNPLHLNRFALPQAWKTPIAPLHVNQKQNWKPQLHPDEICWCRRGTGEAGDPPGDSGDPPGDRGHPRPGASGWQHLPSQPAQGRRHGKPYPASGLIAIINTY